VAWPATEAFEKVGFKDAYRTIYPDEMKKPGYTWTPTTRHDDPKDHHDRIDFIFTGAGMLPAPNGAYGRLVEYQLEFECRDTPGGGRVDNVV